MSNLRYRAWRFVHPDLDAEGGRGGLRLDSRGHIEMVEGADSVRQAVLLLLSTVPGERAMRPTYGCDLYRLAFSPNDATTAGLAIHYVRRALERWEPRVRIMDLDANQHAERPELLEIVLVYRVRVTERVERLELSLNLLGEGS